METQLGNNVEIIAEEEKMNKMTQFPQRKTTAFLIAYSIAINSHLLPAFGDDNLNIQCDRCN